MATLHIRAYQLHAEFVADVHDLKTALQSLFILGIPGFLKIRTGPDTIHFIKQIKKGYSLVIFLDPNHSWFIT